MGNTRTHAVGLLLTVISAALSPTTATGEPGPQLGLPRIDATQPEILDASSAVALGESLFFDNRLSENGSISCASCHQPAHGFSDGKPVAQGIHSRQGVRNTPTLLNAAYNSSQFWDGRRISLEAQALDPFTNKAEHGLASNEQLISVLRSDARYVAAFKKTFSVDSHRIQASHISTALAAYERSLLAGDSPFDRYYVLGEHNALSRAAKRGLALFRGAAGCGDCHFIGQSTSLFTDGAFHRSAQALRRLSTIDVAAATTRVINAEHQGNLASLLVDVEIAALGRFNVTLVPDDIGKFRTPTLRNVTLTAPYMHDGSIPTLDEAVSSELYSRSDGRGLAVTLSERDDLVAFLEALTSSPEALGRLSKTPSQLDE